MFLFIWKEKRSFWFSSVIFLNARPNHITVNRYWTTFERDCKERQLCMGVWCTYSQRNFALLLLIIWTLKQLSLSNKSKSSNVQYNKNIVWKKKLFNSKSKFSFKNTNVIHVDLPLTMYYTCKVMYCQPAIEYKFHLYHLYHELCMLLISLCSTLNKCLMARC